ncbi:hypothetical protein [Peribacillus asahii]|uniref:hypothetical protein n=1 Tax=Peribacillus asahii TaxID=228899 RepID=UPI002079973E|nr:hypothetical protein [Peribacillus asahii]USK62190.1 hypothetical protein LIT37_23730 [Peribacillus asahii]
MFDIFIIVSLSFSIIIVAFLLVAKKRMERNEPVAGWKRKQFLEEQKNGDVSSQSQDLKKKVPDKKKNKDEETLQDLIGLEEIEYGIFKKSHNEFSLIISTDFVNFDLLNNSERTSIILGYQSLWRVINFPLEILGQAVRQDFKRDEERFYKNIKTENAQTIDYNTRVIETIKQRTEYDFRISRRVYYVVNYIYEPSKMGKLTTEQKEQRIVETIYQQANIVRKMLGRARIKSEVLGSLEAMEVLKRAVNRDRMLNMPIETLVEPGQEKITSYITADPDTLPGFEELVQDVEEARDLVQNA